MIAKIWCFLIGNGYIQLGDMTILDTFYGFLSFTVRYKKVSQRFGDQICLHEPECEASVVAYFYL